MRRSLPLAGKEEQAQRKDRRELGPPGHDATVAEPRRHRNGIGSRAVYGRGVLDETSFAAAAAELWTAIPISRRSSSGTACRSSGRVTRACRRSSS